MFTFALVRYLSRSTLIMYHVSLKCLIIQDRAALCIVDCKSPHQSFSAMKIDTINIRINVLLQVHKSFHGLNKTDTF